jgi:hypothetical protein
MSEVMTNNSSVRCREASPYPDQRDVGRARFTGSACSHYSCPG